MKRTTAFLLLIPVAFVLLGLAWGSRQYHWDTLERATLLEMPRHFLHSWDGSPRSQFLSFAHILELPLAWIVRAVLGFPSGMRALVLFEALCAGIVLLLFGLLVRSRGTSRGTAVAAQATLACTWGFWKMGTSGEERILALAGVLLFLAAFWNLLATGRRPLFASGALAFAILCHLSNAILVPFAVLGVLWLPQQYRMFRRRATGAVLVGSIVAALLYVIVAAATTGVRTPQQFWNYLTFFHRNSGNDFFHVSTIVPLWSAWHGLRHFFTASAWVGTLVILGLVGVCLWGGWRRTLSLQARHVLLLVLLWSLHFVFYEPENIESWTLPAAGLLLAAAWCLPRPRQAWGLAGAALVVLCGNVASFRDLHRPLAFQRYLELAVEASAPGDIILMGGGIQNERPLRGSQATRYFLAFEKHRTIVSLYDVMQITQREFWGRPIASLRALQEQIDAGHRVWFPGFLRQEFDAAQQSGLVQLHVRAHGDSLFEVLSVQQPQR